jgi:hypothetical protein
MIISPEIAVERSVSRRFATLADEEDEVLAF